MKKSLTPFAVTILALVLGSCNFGLKSSSEVSSRQSSSSSSSSSSKRTSSETTSSAAEFSVLPSSEESSEPKTEDTSIEISTSPSSSSEDTSEELSSEPSSEVATSELSEETSLEPSSEMSSSEEPAPSEESSIEESSYEPLVCGTPTAAKWASTTFLDLNDSSEEDIRSYYAPLETLPTSQRQGNELLKNLKCILQDFTYHTYDNVWKIYEITDREWELSPAEAMTQGEYDAETNTVLGYKFGSSNSKPGSDNPYVHTLYRNRDENGVTVESGRIREWGDHSQQGGTNREHVWCQSRGFKGSKVTGPAGTDLHHLLSGDGYVNGQTHNNNPYGYVDRNHISDNAGGRYSYCEGNLNGAPLNPHDRDESTIVFEPQDSDKGDIARACFYMAACYNNFANKAGAISDFNPNLLLVDYATSGGVAISSSDYESATMGVLSDLLEWHRLDPVDEYEIHRNNLIYTNFQHNRNPFIDFPEWVDVIWGDAKNEGYASPSLDAIYGE